MPQGGRGPRHRGAGLAPAQPRRHRADRDGWFLPQGNGELRATVVDSRDLRFVAAQALPDTPK